MSQLSVGSSCYHYFFFFFFQNLEYIKFQELCPYVETFIYAGANYCDTMVRNLALIAGADDDSTLSAAATVPGGSTSTLCPPRGTVQTVAASPSSAGGAQPPSLLATSEPNRPGGRGGDGPRRTGGTVIYRARGKAGK
jgi:hypothetical protein